MNPEQIAALEQFTEAGAHLNARDSATDLRDRKG
jgi:hypothetical protein